MRMVKSSDPFYELDDVIYCKHHKVVHEKDTTPFRSQLEECELGIFSCGFRGCMCSPEIDKCCEDDWQSVFITNED